MAESNTDNSGVPVNKPKSVQERIEANARARKTLRDRIGKAINNQSLDNTSQPTVTSQQLPSPNSDPKKKARTRNIFAKMFSVNAEKSHVRQPKIAKNTKWLIVIVTLTICVVGSLTAIVISTFNTNQTQEELADEEDGGGCPMDEDGDSIVEDDEEAQQNITNILNELNEMNVSDSIEYLNEKLDEYTGTSTEFGVRETLIYLLIRNGDNNAALEYLEQIEPESLSGKQFLDYYAMYYKTYSALGEEETANIYMNQYAALYDALYWDTAQDYIDEYTAEEYDDEWIEGETSSGETVIENLPTVIEDMVAEAESLPQQEAVEYLNTKLQEYTGTTAEFGTRMTLIFQYLRMGDSAAALAVAEAIDTEKLDNEQRLDYFNAMAKISYAEGDSAAGEWYQIQYGSLYESIYGENNEY